jgi:ribose transport system substrate-binding protein
MEMKKRLLLVLAIISVVVLVLVACGTSKKPVETETTGAADKKWNIGLSIQGANNDWATASYAHFKYALEAYKDQTGNVYFAECGYDPQKQLADIEDLLTKNIDALLVQPVSETALASVVEKAHEQGVKVIVYGGAIGTDVYDGYMDRDHKATGSKYAEYVCERLEGKGNVVVIMGYPGSGYSNAVLAGVDEVLANYPDIKSLGVEYAEYTPAMSKQILEGYFAKGDSVDGVICDGGLMGFGVLEAFNDANKAIPPMSCDDTYLFLNKAVELEFSDFICCSSAQELSYDAIELLFNVLNDKPCEKENHLLPQVLTGEDALTKIDPTTPNNYWYFSKIPAERLNDFF